MPTFERPTLIFSRIRTSCFRAAALTPSMRKGCVFRSVCPDSENLKTRVGDHLMDSAAIGSSSMKLDNKRAPYAAGPLRQASRLHMRVTPVRCLADFPEPRFRGFELDESFNGLSKLTVKWLQAADDCFEVRHPGAEWLCSTLRRCPRVDSGECQRKLPRRGLVKIAAMKAKTLPNPPAPTSTASRISLPGQDRHLDPG